LALPGLNCTTPAGTSTFKIESWSWGASNTTSIGGGGSTGKTNIQDLSVLKAFDSCSAALFGFVTKGEVLKDATLTQHDADGNTTATVTLEVVRGTSWQVSSSTAQDAPTESLSLGFRKGCIADTASGNKLCFDQATP
jgi:type VI protein secretion system component Hcp